MRGSAVALMVIVLVTGMVAPVAACAGGDPPKTYLNEERTLEFGEHHVTQFELDKEDHLEFSSNAHVNVDVLKEEEYNKYQAGENYTVEVHMGDDAKDHAYKTLQPGRYYVIVNNNWVNETQDVEVTVYRPGVKADCAAEPPFPFIPGFQMELAAVAIAVATVLGITMNRRA